MYRFYILQRNLLGDIIKQLLVSRYIFYFWTAADHGIPNSTSLNTVMAIVCALP